jgi:hypothetical protein
MEPRVHGHPPLTDLYTVEALEGLETALGGIGRPVR